MKVFSITLAKMGDEIGADMLGLPENADEYFHEDVNSVKELIEKICKSEDKITVDYQAFFDGLLPNLERKISEGWQLYCFDKSEEDLPIWGGAILVKEINDIRITVKKVNGEWQAVWYENNKRNEEKTYFTGGGDASHKADAIATKAEMEKRLKNS
jgi:hypothetical protein